MEEKNDEYGNVEWNYWYTNDIWHTNNLDQENDESKQDVVGNGLEGYGDVIENQVCLVQKWPIKIKMNDQWIEI